VIAQRGSQLGNTVYAFIASRSQRRQSIILRLTVSLMLVQL